MAQGELEKYWTRLLETNCRPGRQGDRDAVDLQKGLAVTAARVYPTQPVLLTLDEAAAFLRTPVATLRYWRHLGIGPAGFRLGRRVLYRRADLEQWVSDRHDAQTDRQSGASPA
jgi:hypothetical protein